MEDLVELIDGIIEEHEIKRERLEEIQGIANDLVIADGLEKARDIFVPGRPDQQKSLEKLWKHIMLIEEWLDRHFNHEESTLIESFKQHAKHSTFESLSSLFSEHKDLRSRISHTKRDIDELINRGLARHYWEASAYDMKVYLSHTIRLFFAHADREALLLMALRSELIKARSKRNIRSSPV